MSILSQPSDSESEIHEDLGPIQPSLSDVLLALTLPPSALALCVWMPKRRRERILEVTKTITVTEIVNQSPRVISNGSEVTVTDVEIGESHPVIVHISQTTDQYPASADVSQTSTEFSQKFTTSPLINCEEEDDIVETVHTVNEKFIQYAEPNDISFARTSDNVIDIEFYSETTEPNITSKHKSGRTVKPAKSLDVLLLSPTDTGIYTSLNRSGAVDGTESEGSMIIHTTDDEHRVDSGVSSVNAIHIRENRNLVPGRRLVPMSSDDEDDLIYLPSMANGSSTIPRSSRKKPRTERKYIVTSLIKSHSNPSVYHSHKINNRDDDQELGKKRETSSTFDIRSGSNIDNYSDVVEKDISRVQIQCSDRIPRCHSYAVTSVKSHYVADNAEGKDVEYAKHKITVDLELDRAKKRAEGNSHHHEFITIENVYQTDYDVCTSPPKMASTPMSTLEKNASARNYYRDEDVRKVHSTDYPLSTDDNSRIFHATRESFSSPIVVVNQDRSRKGSMDYLSAPREGRRKSTVTDIDWYAAFNMKEPNTPRSPRSPNPVDVLKECEKPYIGRIKLTQKLPPAHIEVDQIFQYNHLSENTGQTCMCSACALTKIGDEELREILMRKLRDAEKHTYTYPEDRQTSHSHQRYSSLPEADISIDDVFNIQTTKFIDTNDDQSLNPREDAQPTTPREIFELDYSSEVPISMDDVFIESSDDLKPKDNFNFDKYLERSRELRNRTQQEPIITSKKLNIDSPMIRKSSLPEADITLEDVFEQNSDEKKSESPLYTPPNTPLNMHKYTEVEKKYSEKPQISTTEDKHQCDKTNDESPPINKSTSTGRKSFSVKFSTDVEETVPEIIDPTLIPTESPVRKIRKPPPPDERTTVFDIFNIDPPSDDKTDSTTRTENQRNVDSSTNKSVTASYKPSATGNTDDQIPLVAPVAPERKNRPTRESDVRTTTLDISMDDVFSGTSDDVTPHDRFNYDKYLERSREMKQEHRRDIAFNVAHKIEEHADDVQRKSSLPEADISVDDLFSTRPRVVPQEPVPAPLEPSAPEATEAPERRTKPAQESDVRTTTLDISMDDVFSGTSDDVTPHDRFNYDKYLERSREMKQEHRRDIAFNVAHKIEEHADDVQRKSSLPEADISVDDLFNTRPRVVPQEPVPAPLEPSAPEATEAPERRTKPAQESDVRTTTLDISMDDVFSGTSDDVTPHDRFNYDKYLERSREMKQEHRRDIAFNVAHKIEEHADDVQRKSSLPEADISVDDLFNTRPSVVPQEPVPAPSEPSAPVAPEAPERRTKPAQESDVRTTTLDISMDDVFSGTSDDVTPHDRFNYDKYLERSREMKQEHRRDIAFNVAHKIEEHADDVQRKSSLPEADISVDDLFNTRPSVVPQEPVPAPSEPSAPVAPEAPERRTKPAQESDVRTTTLDISMDDVFSGTSDDVTPHDRFNYDKYLERSREMKQEHRRDIAFNVAHKIEEHADDVQRKSSLPEADISVDDLFNTRPRVVPQEPVPAPSEPSAPVAPETTTAAVAPEAPERRTKPAQESDVRTTTLDISMDDVFSGTSDDVTPHDRFNYDKYLERSREMKQEHRRDIAFNVAHKIEEHADDVQRKSSLPEADISVDDLFNTRPRVVPQEPVPAPSEPSAPVAPEAPERRTKPAQESDVRTTTLDISMDDVFSGTSDDVTPHDRFNYDKYLERSREMKQEHRRDIAFNVAHKIEEHADDVQRKSSLPEADISVDDLFNTRPSVVPQEPVPAPSEPSAPVAPEAPERRTKPAQESDVRTTTLDISMDDVFSGTSDDVTPHDRFNYDKYLERSREMKQEHRRDIAFNVAHKIEEHADDVQRKSSLPEADISVDDLFNTRPRVVPQEPVPAPSEPSAPVAPETTTAAVAPEAPERRTKPAQESDVRTTTLDISMDDVFSGTSDDVTPHDRFNYDKYLERSREMKQEHRRDIAFNVAHKIEEHADDVQRKSSLPEADISVDDLFNTRPRVVPQEPVPAPSEPSAPVAPEAPERRTKPAQESDVRTTTLDISMDDVFSGTSDDVTPHDRFNYDKYLERSREMKQEHRRDIAFNVAHKIEEHADDVQRKSSLPEADISVDDLFNTRPRVVPQEPVPAPSEPSAPVAPETTTAAVAPEAPERRTKPAQESDVRTTTLDISMDDVFSGTSDDVTPHDRFNYDKYLERSREMKQEHRRDIAFNVAHKIEEHADDVQRKSSLPEADISVDDLFNTRPSVVPQEPVPAPSEPSAPVAPEAPERRTKPAQESDVRTTTLDISMDDVFSGTSDDVTPHDRFNYDKYLERSREMKQEHRRDIAFNVAHKIEEHADDVQRKSSLPEADISVDDLFNTRPRVVPQEPVPAPSEPSAPEATEAPERRTEPAQESDVRTTTLDISMDDVFSGTSDDVTPHDRFNYDKYLERSREMKQEHRRDIAFNVAHKIEEHADDVQRKSSLPEADISVDDLFSTRPRVVPQEPVPAPLEPSAPEATEAPERRTKPAQESDVRTTTLDISMDDVFSGTSDDVTPHDRFNYDKYLERSREMKQEHRRDIAFNVAHKIEEHADDVKRKSSLPEADISVDDLFNTRPRVVPQEPVPAPSEPSAPVTPETTTAAVAPEAPERRTKPAQESDVRTTTLDISMDDVFSGTSDDVTPHDRFNYDKYLERSREMKQEHRRDIAFNVAHKIEEHADDVQRKSSLPEADISVDDLFNTRPSVVPQEPVPAPSEPSAPVAPEAPERRTKPAQESDVRTTTLDISMDDVFSGTSDDVTPHDRFNYDKYLERSREMKQEHRRDIAFNVAHKIEEHADDVQRKSSLPEADISVDDLFNTRPRVVPQEPVPAPSEPSAPEATEAPERRTEPAQESDVRTTTLDISMDDVFSGTSDDVTPHDRFNYDKYLERSREMKQEHRRDIAFNVAHKIEEHADDVQRKSSLPEADISVDDLFNTRPRVVPQEPVPAPSEPSAPVAPETTTAAVAPEAPERRTKPAQESDVRTTTLDISMDDVFSGTSDDVTPHDRFNYDKYLERSREMKQEHRRDIAFNVAHKIEEHADDVQRKSSLPEADISVDDLFNTRPSVVPQEPVPAPSEPSAPVAPEAPERRTKPAQESDVRTTTLDISMDDVFSGTSDDVTPHDRFNYDKYLERSREMKQEHRRDIAFNVAHKIEEHADDVQRKSSLPEADISVDDLFNTRPRVVPQEPVPAPSEPSAPEATEAPERRTEPAQESDVRTTTLDISMDDVFSGTSDDVTPHDRFNYDKYLERSREMKQEHRRDIAFNVAHKIEEHADDVQRKSSLPEADISVDDLFSTRPRVVPQEPVPAPLEPSAPEATEAPERRTKPAQESDVRTTTLDISMDDVFSGTSDDVTPHDRFNYDKYLERSREMKQEHRRDIAFNVAHKIEEHADDVKRKSSLPEADISVDDLFNTRPRVVPQEPVPAPSEPSAPVTPETTTAAVAPEAPERRTKPAQESDVRTTTLDISMDDVFSGTSDDVTPHDRFNYDKYLERSREMKQEHRRDIAFNVAHKIEEHADDVQRKSSLPEADISVDDLFNTRPSVVPQEPVPAPSEPSAPVAPEAPERRTKPAQESDVRTTTLDISMDDVFSGTSDDVTPHDRFNYDKYLERSREMKQEHRRDIAFNVAHKIEEHADDVQRKSSLPEADISVDDLFNTRPRVVPQEPVPAPSEPSAPEATEAPERRTEPAQESDVRTTTLDISMDDVFSGTSDDVTPHDRFNYDKYLERSREMKQEHRRDIAFNVAHKIEEHADDVQRKSSLPEADISVDDLFNTRPRVVPQEPVPAPSEPSAPVTPETTTAAVAPEAPERRTKPAQESDVRTTTLDISMDDVFSGTSDDVTPHDRFNYDKYLERSREMKQEHRRDIAFNVAHKIEEHADDVKRKSSLPEADISVDDLFNTRPRVVPQESVPAPSEPSAPVTPETTTAAVAPEAPERRTKPAQESDVRTTTLDISMDDVFSGTSDDVTPHDRFNYDKYLERSREMKQEHRRDIAFNVAHKIEEHADDVKRKSSLPEADISVDDLFSTRPRVVPQEPVPAPSEPSAPVAPEAPERRTKPAQESDVRTTTLDISMDDVFSGTSDDVIPHDRFNYDKYLERSREMKQEHRRDIAFNVAHKIEEHADDVQRKSSLPEADISVFSGTSDDVTPHDRFNFDKYLERSREVKQEQIKQNTSEHERSQASGSELNYSFDDNDDTNSSVRSRYRIQEHKMKLQVSLDDLSPEMKQLPSTTRVTVHEDHPHIISSSSYNPVLSHTFKTSVFARHSIVTDELDDITASSNLNHHKVPLHFNSHDPPESGAFADFYNDLKSPPRTPLKFKRRSIDFYYEEPLHTEFEDVDVEDFVDEILNQSLDEAAFLATSRQKSLGGYEPRSTDTSIDRKYAHSPIEKNYGITSSTTTHDKPLFVASTSRDSLFEAILSYPAPDSSRDSTLERDTSTSKTVSETVVKKSSKSVSPRDRTFVSEASVVMRENPDDYYVRLVFPDTPSNQEKISIIRSPETNLEEYTTYTTTQTVVRSNVVDQTSNLANIVEKRSPQQKDDEYLEVEANSEYFIIRGNYSMVINRNEHLGEMLSKISTSSLDFTVTPKLRRILRQCLHDKIAGNSGTDVSSRAFHMLSRFDPAFDIFFKMFENRYTNSNKEGNINFCTAENLVCHPLLKDRLGLAARPNEEHLFHYAPAGGYENVKDVFHKYLIRFMNASKISKDDLTFVGSGTTAYDHITHILYEPDDVLLTNTPTYARIFIDCNERSGCHVEPVPFDLTNPEINLSIYEKVFQDQIEKGNNVKGVILVNPHNPMGLTFSKKQVIALANWANGHNLTLLVDESFSNSNHGVRQSDSFLSYLHELDNPNKVVWFWSLSKDFGLPGVKICVVHTLNHHLKEILSLMELTYPVSAIAQDFASNLLSDFEWVRYFHETKNERIHKHFEFVAKNLEALGLTYVLPTAGFYVLVNFNKKMADSTYEEEEKLWHKLISHGVYLTRGKDMKCPEPGWMRIVFGCDKDQVIEGIRRLHKVFGSNTDVIGSINY